MNTTAMTTLVNSRQEMLEHLAEIVRKSLDHASFADIRGLEISVEDTRLVISGILDSYYHKQLVQQLMGFAYRKGAVDDRIRVIPRA